MWRVEGAHRGALSLSQSVWGGAVAVHHARGGAVAAHQRGNLRYFFIPSVTIGYSAVSIRWTGMMKLFLGFKLTIQELIA